MPAPVTAQKANPPLSGGELARGAALGAWIFLCDMGLKVAARVGGCPTQVSVTDAFEQIWGPLEECPGTALAGPSLLLRPEVSDGALFGFMDGQFGGVPGQMYALALLAIATITAILILRWRWRDSGDALALGVLWGGVLAHAVPRFMGEGTSYSELWAFGLTTGVADLAIVWGLVWLAWRFVAETRA